MELTEIFGNIRLCFKDFAFGLPVCASAEHIAQLDSESEYGFERVLEQYLNLLQTAVKLQNMNKPFDLYFSVFGNRLSDPPGCEPQTLYYCHVQGWDNRLSVELLLPGHHELVHYECSLSRLTLARATERAVYFAFGGFVFAFANFKLSEIDLSNPYVSESLDLYCLSDDKQLLLDELFNTEYIIIRPYGESTKKE